MAIGRARFGTIQLTDRPPSESGEPQLLVEMADDARRGTSRSRDFLRVGPSDSMDRHARPSTAQRCPTIRP